MKEGAQVALAAELQSLGDESIDSWQALARSLLEQNPIRLEHIRIS
jgi:hypothetical protein